LLLFLDDVWLMLDDLIVISLCEMVVGGLLFEFVGLFFDWCIGVGMLFVFGVFVFVVLGILIVWYLMY